MESLESDTDEKKASLLRIPHYIIQKYIRKKIKNFFKEFIIFFYWHVLNLALITKFAKIC